MNDTRYCVTTAVATTAVSPSITTSVTASPLIVLLHRDKGQWPIHAEQAESITIRDACSDTPLPPYPGKYRKFWSPFRAPKTCHIFLWTYLAQWLQLDRGTCINSALKASKFCDCGVLKYNSVSQMLSPGHLYLPARLFKKAALSRLALKRERQLLE